MSRPQNARRVRSLGGALLAVACEALRTVGDFPLAWYSLGLAQLCASDLHAARDSLQRAAREIESRSLHRLEPIEPHSVHEPS